MVHDHFAPQLSMLTISRILPFLPHFCIFRRSLTLETLVLLCAISGAGGLPLRCSGSDDIIGIQHPHQRHDATRVGQLCRSDDEHFTWRFRGWQIVELCAAAPRNRSSLRRASLNVTLRSYSDTHFPTQYTRSSTSDRVPWGLRQIACFRH